MPFLLGLQSNRLDLVWHKISGLERLLTWSHRAQVMFLFFFLIRTDVLGKQRWWWACSIHWEVYVYRQVNCSFHFLTLQCHLEKIFGILMPSLVFHWRSFAFILFEYTIHFPFYPIVNLRQLYKSEHAVLISYCFCFQREDNRSEKDQMTSITKCPFVFLHMTMKHDH